MLSIFDANTEMRDKQDRNMSLTETAIEIIISSIRDPWESPQRKCGGYFISELFLRPNLDNLSI